MVHVIDEQSPLFGLSPEEFEAESVRVHVTFVGIDDIYAQTVHWWHGYSASQIKVAKRFVDMVTFQPDESVVIDYTKIDQYES